MNTAPQRPIDHIVYLTTGRCNLGCTYCFQGSHDNWFAQDSTPEVARAAIDFLMENSGPNQHVTVGFFGGEPTLRPDLMEIACDYAVQRANELGKTVGFSVTTNITTVTEKLIRLIKRFNISVLASIDGLPRPTNQRFYKGTTNSSGGKALENLFWLKDNGIRVDIRWTTTPLTIRDVHKDVIYFAENGFRSIALEFAYEADWTQEDLKVLEDELRKIGKYYISEIKAGRDLTIKSIDDAFEMYNRDTRMPYRCGLALYGAGVSPNGDIMPCHRFCSQDDHQELKVGNVFEGWNARREAIIEDFGAEKFRVSDGRKCEDCPIMLRCPPGGGCLAVNRDMGDYYTIPSVYCDIQLVIQRVGNDVLGVLYSAQAPLMLQKLGERPPAQCGEAQLAVPGYADPRDRRNQTGNVSAGSGDETWRIPPLE